MKSVLISIKPKWCEKIASGEKTVEVRKTRPKIETPFKCYIYCTKGEAIYMPRDIFGKEALNGKVIGEFVCDKIYDCRDVDIKDTCLTVDEWLKYTEGHKGIVYGWHISNLVIYDKPKELSSFVVPSKTGCVNEGKCRGCIYFDRGNGYNVEDDCNAKFCTDEYKPLRRPPQSWCYVEEVKR